MGDLFEFHEYDLSLIDPKHTFIADALSVGQAEMYMAAHACGNPEHTKDTSEKFICLIFRDHEGESFTVLIHPQSLLAHQFSAGHVSEMVEVIVQNC